MYDEIAEFYHLIFEDWDASIERQALQLGALIRSIWSETRTVLDVTCGIGTQSIGLAKHGFKVTASDVSSASVARAKREAQDRDLRIAFTVCDIREIVDHHRAVFDVVMSCDNSIPHLLSDDDISEALIAMFACVRPGGGSLVTLRDYERQEEHKDSLLPHGLRTLRGKRYAVFQTRTFDGDRYDVTMYFVEESDPPKVQVGRSRYYAVGPDRVMELMRNVGFIGVRRLDNAFYQPVLLGTRPNSSDAG